MIFRTQKTILVVRNGYEISGPPVDVGVTMYVLSISSLSEVKMVFKSLLLSSENSEADLG